MFWPHAVDGCPTRHSILACDAFCGPARSSSITLTNSRQWGWFGQQGRIFFVCVMVVYSTRRRGGRGLAYILYICVREQVHLTQCRDFLVTEARATSKLWNWLFKHHTTPFWATCIYILARTLTCDASICGPTRPSSMHACITLTYIGRG